MTKIGLSLARQKEAFIACHGSAVHLPDGTTRKALIHHNDHELLRMLRSEGDGSEKKPVVLVFGGSAWGRVTEGARVTIGGDVTVTTAAGTPKTVSMARDFLVADPLHPKWRQGVVTELVVVAFPD